MIFVRDVIAGIHHVLIFHHPAPVIGVIPLGSAAVDGKLRQYRIRVLINVIIFPERTPQVAEIFLGIEAEKNVLFGSFIRRLFRHVGILRTVDGHTLGVLRQGISTCRTGCEQQRQHYKDT